MVEVLPSTHRHVTPECRARMRVRGANYESDAALLEYKGFRDIPLYLPEGTGTALPFHCFRPTLAAHGPTFLRTFEPTRGHVGYQLQIDPQHASNAMNFTTEMDRCRSPNNWS
jgi:hypothetical protein